MGLALSTSDQRPRFALPVVPTPLFGVIILPKASGRSLPPVIAKLLTALPTLPLFPHVMFGFEKRQTGDVSS